MTYSFGSIAEGSLIVALLDVIRAGLNVVQQQEAMSGDAVGACIACCASCLVGCVRGLVDYFNRWATVHWLVWIYIMADLHVSSSDTHTSRLQCLANRTSTLQKMHGIYSSRGGTLLLVISAQHAEILALMIS